MKDFSETVFIVSAGALFYTWLLYPLALVVLRLFGSIQFRRDPAYLPSVSIVLVCLNEAKQLVDRIENLLSLDYPRDKLEIIVASDGSTDRTHEIAESYADRGVTAVNFPARRGKAPVHNDLMGQVQGDIVVFTDTDPRFERNLLRILMEPLADPRVGCVVGEIDWVNRGNNSLTRHQGLYWRFEILLRRLEGDLGVLTVGSGACMAVRRPLLRKLAKPSYDIDFITPLDVIEQGYFVLDDPTTIITDYVLPTPKGEFRAQVRMTAKNFPGSLERWWQMRPWRFPGASISLVSHKFFRWLTPMFMIVAFMANLFLVHAPLYRIALVCQLTFYGLASLGAVVPNHTARGGLGVLLMLPFSFCLANVAFLWGTLKGFFGKPIATYQNIK